MMGEFLADPLWTACAGFLLGVLVRTSIGNEGHERRLSAHYSPWTMGLYQGQGCGRNFKVLTILPTRNRLVRGAVDHGEVDDGR